MRLTIDPRYLIVAALENADEWTDKVLLNKSVVALTRPLPRWWQCELSRLSQWLDDRLHTGYWDDPNRWGAGPPCEICGRMASIFETGTGKSIVKFCADHSHEECVSAVNARDRAARRRRQKARKSTTTAP